MHRNVDFFDTVKPKYYTFLSKIIDISTHHNTSPCIATTATILFTTISHYNLTILAAFTLFI